MVTLTLTPEQFAAKRQALADNGVALDGDRGTITAKGCTFSYVYQNGLLTAGVVKAPFGMKGLAESKLRGWLES